MRTIKIQIRPVAPKTAKQNGQKAFSTAFELGLFSPSEILPSSGMETTTCMADKAREMHARTKKTGAMHRER